jgi:hypothetical protein
MNLSNTILNKSRQLCIQSCTADRKGFSLSIVGSDVGDIDASQVCVLQGNGCKLRASLDTALDSTLDAFSKQTDLEENDPLNFSIGDSTSQSAVTKQTIKNVISNTMDSICKAPATVSGENANVVIISSSVGTIDLSQRSTNTNNNCYIENTARSNIKNKIISKIEQTIVKGSILLWVLICIVAVIGLIVIGIVLVVMFKTGGVIAEKVAETQKAKAQAKAMGVSRGVSYK